MKESLVPHETTVLEKKPVKCKIGLNSFEGKHNLNSHKRTVHENELFRESITLQNNELFKR